ncbi:RICIN domain-containing protein [Streptomyces shenzhenensis]|uniref:RICIN domain-containing protein n=1 Tax=Streptomyces shenzhenensis TaxID=943815 RepID=UPI001F1686F0|nr:RICIN domain-containing protein [Streptomyces shenzhenensis]
MPPLRKPRPPAERSGTTTGRFSDTFARRPAVPRRGLVPGVRVWATVAAAAGLTVVVAAAVPLLSRVDLFPDPDTTPAAAVAAGEPTTLSSASGSPSPSSSKPSHAPSAHKPGKTGSAGSGSVGGTGIGSAGQQSGGGSVGSGSNSNSGSTSSGSKSGGSGSSSGKTSSGTSSSGTSSSGTSSSGGSGTTTTTVPGVALIGTASGRCIDVTNAGGDGTRLELLDCSGAAKQKWVFQSDGTIRSLGLCMDLAWGNTANGTAIQVAKCSGNRAQLFYLSAQGDLVSAQADKCVDATDNSTGNGTKLQLWTCSGTPNQKWHKG